MLDRRLIKPEPFRSRTYLSFIRLWSCLVCGTRDSIHACHTGPHGLSTKASDLQTLPLCPVHHLGKLGLDTLGPERFETEHNLDLKAQCLWHINCFLTFFEGKLL